MKVLRITNLRKVILLLASSLLLVVLYFYRSLQDNETIINPKIMRTFGALPDPFDENGVFHSQHATFANKMPDLNGEIDWHDYIMIEKEKQRTGPGEQGRGVIIDASEENEKKKLNSLNGFNAYASDKISLARSVADIRHLKCSNLKYLKELPTVSIVIPFYEEHWSTLLRTVVSTLNRASPDLIKEVILVDDGSSHKAFLKEQLENYVNKTFPHGLVKVLRNEKREGLIRTRLVGARAAIGDVIIFLDSHVEASTNWLPPLLDPIARDYRTVTCPFIDVLGDEWEFRAQDQGGRGSFAWNFDYKRLPRLKEDKKHPHLPFDSPIMAGGLFAISRKWFWELGGYDEGLYIWGGEQYEISFKIWMCGGKMIDVPCSRIAHAYRSHFPFPNNMPNSLNSNYRRVAEVWLDDYKEALYKKSPAVRNAPLGDISKQKKIREDLNCKSFDWFLKNVAFDLLPRYPIKTPMAAMNGTLYLVSNPDLCIVFSTANLLEVGPCIASDISYTFRGEIRNSNLCVENHGSGQLNTYRCHGYYLNQKWILKFIDNDIEKGEFVLRYMNSCLEAEPVSKIVMKKDCDYSANQVFKFSNNYWRQANEEWERMGLLKIAEA